MKWFKHMTGSHTDEKLAGYLSDTGLEGYGFWWLLMEVVAAQCVDDKCSVTYSLPHWSRLLYSHHHRVSKYLGKLGVTGIVTVEYIEGNIRVTIPNLLKYRDEYSQKSGQNREKVGSKKEKEKEKEEADKEKPLKPLSPDKPDDPRDTIPYKDVFEMYNRICKSFAKAGITDARKNDVRLRWGTYQKHPDGPLAIFESVFIKAEASDFVSGRDGKWSGKRGIDWLLNSKNMTKILEGNYDNKNGGKRENREDWEKSFCGENESDGGCLPIHGDSKTT